jgi:hypothetical protein
VTLGMIVAIGVVASISYAFDLSYGKGSLFFATKPIVGHSMVYD